MATYRFNIPSSGGTYTAATLDSECEIENQISVSGNTIFNEIVTPSSIVFDGTNLVFTAKASQATSETQFKIYIRYIPNVNAKMRIIHNEQIFEINAVLGDKRSGMLTMMVKEVE